MTVDPHLVAAWLAGRSLGRGMPPPIADHGGLRVDTATGSEMARWIFTSPDAAITRLTDAVRLPGYEVKLCANRAELAALLASGWHVTSEHCMMVGGSPHAAAPLPPGYIWLRRQTEGVTHLRILAADGMLAASGYVAETNGAFVYDRIITMDGHRRRGLGLALMAALGREKRSASSVDILTATDAGRHLYASLGWRVYAPWSTAVFAAGGSSSS